jgi:hypothetical protein
MTLGEIKAEALKIMVANAEFDVNELDIGMYKQNPAYASYIYAMTGAVNRAFDRLYILGAVDEEILPVSVYTEETADLNATRGVPNVLLRMIPLFVVGDVYATDDPNMAASCRNQFEANVEEYVKRFRYTSQDSVEVAYEV